MQDRSAKKALGWVLILVAVITLAIGDSVPSIASLLITFAAMLIGGVGLFFAFDDA